MQAHEAGPHVGTPASSLEPLSVKDIARISSAASIDDDMLDRLAVSSRTIPIRNEIAAHLPALMETLERSLDTQPPEAGRVYATMTILRHVAMHGFDGDMDAMDPASMALRQAATARLGKEAVDDIQWEWRVRRVVDTRRTGHVFRIVFTASGGSASGMMRLACETLLDLARVQDIRARLAQQGVVPLLALAFHSHHRPDSSQEAVAIAAAAARAAARILTRVNPELLFSGSTRLASASLVRVLAYCLEPDPGLGGASVAWSRSCFEALVALANLGSADEDARRVIMNSHFDALLTVATVSADVQLQRAAVEVFCNCCTSDQVCMAIGTTPHGRKLLDTLIVCMDVADTATRIAATGALAMLSETPQVVDALRERQTRPDVIGTMVALLQGDEADDVRLRVGTALCTLATVDDALRKRIRLNLAEKHTYRATDNEDVLELTSELEQICATTT